MLSLAQQIGKKLRAGGETFSVAESCTGGYISHLITSVAGSSAYFKGSVIAYDNQIKTTLLKVRSGTLKKYGAVSAETAAEMVIGVRKAFRSDFAIATTGIAGPGGAIKGKPVGTVYIAFGTKNELLVVKCSFKGNRQKVIKSAAGKALEMLLNSL